jgi:hypothetical protein
MDTNDINDTVIGEVRKNLSSVLKVSVGEFKGRTYIYFQTWEKGERDPGEGTPTSRGMTMRPSTLRDLLPLLPRALEEAAARKEKHVDGSPQPEQPEQMNDRSSAGAGEKGCRI